MKLKKLMQHSLVSKSRILENEKLYRRPTHLTEGYRQLSAIRYRDYLRKNKFMNNLDPLQNIENRLAIIIVEHSLFYRTNYFSREPTLEEIEDTFREVCGTDAIQLVINQFREDFEEYCEELRRKVLPQAKEEYFTGFYGLACRLLFYYKKSSKNKKNQSYVEISTKDNES
jgi:hypothetical protein